MRASRSGEGWSLVTFRAAFSRSRMAIRSACECWISCKALICAPNPMGMGSVEVTVGDGEVGPDIARREDVWYTMVMKKRDGV